MCYFFPRLRTPTVHVTVIVMRGLVPALALATLAITLIGCDENFLTREPPSEQPVESFYQSAEDARVAVNAAYEVLDNAPFYRAAWKVDEVPADDVILINTSGGEHDNFTFNASSSFLQEMWSINYQGIFRANLVLDRVPGIEMDEDLKARYLAEAKFLRAYYYWWLTTLFGDVPLLTEPPEGPEDAEVAKSPQSEIYAQMILDLEGAAEVLPAAYPDEQVGRATKGAAQALLGKVYLYDENYSEAERWLQMVIDSETYELLPSFQDVFIVENNNESILEIQYNIRNSHSRPGDLLPRSGGDANMQPTQDLVDAFEDYSGPDSDGVFDGKDPRLYYSVWRDGDDFDEVFPTFRTDWTTTGYAVKKGLYPVERFPSNPSWNWPLIRLADVLLMYAEAANENGDLSAAREAVNRVRARVNMPSIPTAEYPAGNEQEMFEAIVHERRAELAFEYHRYNDLRRWGLAPEQLGALGYEPRNRYYPIPQGEIDVNESLEQNPDY